jgi:hypothetical protein
MLYLVYTFGFKLLFVHWDDLSEHPYPIQLPPSLFLPVYFHGALYAVLITVGPHSCRDIPGFMPRHARAGGFSRAAARAHSTLHAPLRLMGPPCVALLNFWIPVGLVLASRVLLFASACLVPLCIPASYFSPTL